ncbi:MAG: histidine kinase [Bacteroidota bacterium]
MKLLSPVFQRRYLFHFIVWLVYGVYNLMNVEDYIRKQGWLFALSPLAISVLLLAMLIYVNAFLLIPRLLDKKKTILYIIAVLALVVLNTYLKALSKQHYDAIVWPKDLMLLRDYFKWNLFDSFWSILISTLLLFSLRWSRQNERVKNIEVAQLHSELKYLRAQLNPHFLFNGLNTIYGTIDIENTQARDMMVQFSDLLRYNLYEADVDWITLEKEVVYLENYVALQRARSDSNLVIELQIGITDNTVLVAPLIFVAFVENAFKYSTRDDRRTNSVSVSLKQENDKLIFDCRNSYEAIEPGNGIGLANVKRRLELLYPDRHSLEIQQTDGFYSVHLILNT